MPMKLSLFTVTFAGFWGQHKLSLEESIDQAAALGFSGVEIMGKRPHLWPLDVSVEDCKRLRERVERNKLKVSAIAAYTNFTGGMDSAEVPLADMQVAYVEQLAARARAMGTDLVRIFTSYERQDVPFFTQWTKTIAAIRECCDRAADHGVTIGVQNHHDIGVDTKTLGELLRQVDRKNCIAMYDCWSAHLRGEDIAAGVKQMAPKMRFTTVADYVVLPRSRYRPELVNYQPLDPPFAQAVPMGTGDLDYRAFFSMLSASGFEGWASYEMCSPVRDGGALETLQTYCRGFITYMKPWSSATDDHRPQS